MTTYADDGRSVIVEPKRDDTGTSGPLEWILSLAMVADDITPWGQAPLQRDRQLRSFWPTEPILASAIFSTASRYAAFGWTLDGPPRTVRIIQQLFHTVERGAGWEALMLKFVIDLFTQDNGAFMEIVRTEDSPTAPTVSLNHLDSNRCARTGREDYPVIYTDLEGKRHALAWYQVIALTEMPSPIERFRGMQYCAVTRMLRAAQILKDISIYTREKVSGRFNRAMHFVSGITDRTIQENLKLQAADANAQGLTRFIQPLVMGSIDPTAKVAVASIDFATLPDHFDYEQAMRWYVNQLALAFGQDYQDFAPLPGGNLGTAQQSQTLHMKARGKGPKLFMSMVESAFNFRGVIPQTVHFAYGDQDIAEDQAKAALRLLRAQERATRIQSLEITPEIARQLANDTGDLADEYVEELKTTDPNPHLVASSGEPARSRPSGATTVDNARNARGDIAQGRTGAR